MRAPFCFLALAACACGDGIQLLTPGPTPPRLSLSITVQLDSLMHHSESAFLSSGWAADGYPYRFTDSSLIVNGAIVPPFDVVKWQGFQYTWSRAATPTGAMDSTVVKAPPLRDSPSDPIRIAAYNPARLDPLDVTLNPGQDLVLHLTPVSQLPWPPNAVRVWELTLSEQCGFGSRPFRTTSEGAYPDEFRVPRSMIPDSLGSSFAACVHVLVNFQATTAPYSGSVFQTIDARWRVQLAP